MSHRKIHPQTLIDLVKECEDRFSDSGWISVDQFLADQAQRTWVIADVRDLEEREVSIIPEAVAIEECVTELGGSEDNPILIYCTVGCRSGMYAESLREDGYEAYNLWGGSLLGLSMVDRSLILKG